MEETQGQSLWSIIGQSHGVLKQLLRTPRTLVTGGLMVIVGVATVITTAFWPILVTEQLGLDAAYLSLYYVVRSVTMLVFYFTVMPRLRAMSPYKPMIFGFAGMILSWTLLISIPEQSYVLLLVATILEGCSLPAVNTLLEKLVATTVEAKERARIMAILFMVVLMFTSPFGWIAGQLSEINRNLPFILNISLFIIGGLLAFVAERTAKRRKLARESTASEWAP